MNDILFESEGFILSPWAKRGRASDRTAFVDSTTSTSQRSFSAGHERARNPEVAHPDLHQQSGFPWHCTPMESGRNVMRSYRTEIFSPISHVMSRSTTLNWREGDGFHPIGFVSESSFLWTHNRTFFHSLRHVQEPDIVTNN